MDPKRQIEIDTVCEGLMMKKGLQFTSISS